MMNHLVILNVVGLSPEHLDRPDLTPHLSRFAQRGAWRPLRPTFPAVTCSMQATLLTGKPPGDHGIIANGYFDRVAHEVRFWDQPGALVQAPRLWDILKTQRKDFTSAVLFWQNSMYINSDVVITPRPLHLESGLVQWCYSKPAGYYEQLTAQLGPFKLQSYWGPLAGLGSSQWIARAAQATWHRHRPNLLLVYLPHLDYIAQKFGPHAPQTRQALREIDAVVGELLDDFSRDAAVLIVSEYSLTPVRGVLYPNRLLREAGLLRVREIAGREYLDYELSDAWAMVDHQVAHVYCRPAAVESARSVLEKSAGMEFTKIDHPRAGELVAVVPPEKWFAYYWWLDWAKAPDFAYGIDIHRKPGYDPCELWFDWRRMARTFKPATATDPTLVRGSHGRVGSDPRGWAVVIFGEQATREFVPGESYLDATQIAPIILRLFD